MVGDLLREDVSGAKRSGLRAVWKRNRQQHPAVVAGDRPDAASDDLSELRALHRAASASRERRPRSDHGGMRRVGHCARNLRCPGPVLVDLSGRTQRVAPFGSSPASPKAVWNLKR
jgi:hypothetical protein